MEQNFQAMHTVDPVIHTDDNRKYSAVIIDDEVWDIRSLQATINRHPYFEVAATFSDSRSGYEYLLGKRPDLAFVDVSMPDMDGLEILRKALEDHLPTLFIMISAHDDFSYAKKAMHLNAIGYCLKPFDREDLLSVMEKASNMLKRRSDPAAAPAAGPAPDDAYHPEQYRRGDPVPDNKTVQRMLLYLRSHYTEESLSIEELAEHCSIHPNYASQIFRQETGCTIMNYLTGLRVDHACWLLRRTTLPVSEVASAVGYNDSGYFSKVFRKAQGCSPSDYRRDGRSAPAGSDAQDGF